MKEEYHIEQAKNERSKCKKCKESIQKDELRIGTTTESPLSSGETVSITSWHHICCFSLPFDMKQEGSTPESFVMEALTDPDGLLTQHKDEVVAAIESSGGGTPKASPRAAKSKTSQVDASTAIGRIKQNFMEFQDASEANDGDLPKKRAKLSNVEREQIELYKTLKKKTVGELRDYMRWNRQTVKGKKDLLLFKCIDGMMHGRLGRCPKCDCHKLVIRDDVASQKYCRCPGYYYDFDDMIARVACNYKVALAKAPRLHPWFTRPPTAEEEKELDETDEPAKAGGSASAAPASTKKDAVAQALPSSVKDIDDRAGSQGDIDDRAGSQGDIDDRAGSQGDIDCTAAAMLEIAQDCSLPIPAESET